MAVPRALRPVVAVAALAAGVFLSLCTVALHGYVWGLLLGLATVVACLVALPGGWWSRLPFATGWSALVALTSGERREGDYLIASDVNGYLLLAAAVVVFICGLLGLVSHDPAPDDSE